MGYGVYIILQGRLIEDAYKRISRNIFKIFVGLRKSVGHGFQREDVGPPETGGVAPMRMATRLPLWHKPLVDWRGVYL